MLSDLKKTQQQLVQSEKFASIGQLSAGIAHEINNPVGFIGSNISTLEGYMVKLSEYIRSMEILKTTNCPGTGPRCWLPWMRLINLRRPWI
jgi:signal transduction histidine kinase